MYLFEKGADPLHIPTEAQEVYDVTGAGDTVIGTIAISLASERSMTESVLLANHAAGIAVGKVGTSVVTVEELSASSHRSEGKIKTWEGIEAIVEALRVEGRSIVFTNGCFDILHVGHTRLLREAKLLGDVLIVAINSDASVSRLKGPDRPLVPAEERAEMLSCLDVVDFVVTFEQDDPVMLLDRIRPDVHVKGGDYDPDDPNSMPEAQTVRNHGGTVEVIKLVPSRSTSRLVAQVS